MKKPTRRYVSTPALIAGIGFAAFLGLLLALDFRCGFSLWRGWPMLEAVGTISAVFAAIGLAWREGSRARRREEDERLMVRLLLEQEIRANIHEVESSVAWLDRALVQARELLQPEKPADPWRAATTDPPLKAPSMSIHDTTRERLLEQLPFFCRAFDTDEAGQIDTFYDHLYDLQGLLEEYESWQQNQVNPTVSRIHGKLKYVDSQINKLALQRAGIALVKSLARRQS